METSGLGAQNQLCMEQWQHFFLVGRRGRLTQAASESRGFRKQHPGSWWSITSSEDRTVVNAEHRCGTLIADSRNLAVPAAVNHPMPTNCGDTTVLGGHSIPKIGLEFHRFYWYRGFLRYSAKRFRATQRKVICLAVLVGSTLWTVIVSCRPGSLNPIAAS